MSSDGTGRMSLTVLGGIGVTITSVPPVAVAVYTTEPTLLSLEENTDCGPCGTPGTSDVLLVPTPMQ
jgi:hypothetical protein